MLSGTIALMAGLMTAEAAGAPSLPDRPKPPSVDGRSYVFGAHQDGRPSSQSTGQKAAAPKASGSGATTESREFKCHFWSDGHTICAELPQLLGGEESKPKVSPEQLAIMEWGRLPVPAPVVRSAPPRGRDGLVGLPHWFWVANWRPLTSRAEAGGVWIEVTARPQTLLIEPGNGQAAVRCAGPGAAYDRSRPAASQRTDCSYTFTRSSAGLPGGAYRVRVTVVWGGTWVGSGGTGGALPPLTRSVTFPVRVAEAQGLYR